MATLEAMELMARSLTRICDALTIIDENMAWLATGQDAIPVPPELLTAQSEAEASMDSLRTHMRSYGDVIADHHNFSEAQLRSIGQEYVRSEMGTLPGQRSGQLPMADQQPGQPLQEQPAAPPIVMATPIPGFGQPPGPRPTRSDSIGPQQRRTAAARSTTHGQPSALPMELLGPIPRAPPRRTGQLPPVQTMFAEQPGSTIRVKAPPAPFSRQSSANWADTVDPGQDDGLLFAQPVSPQPQTSPAMANLPEPAQPVSPG